jgi:hypothetical protein
MRRIGLAMLTCLLAMMPLCAADNQKAVADVTTSISGFLLHGFRNQNEKEIHNTASVTDAFSKEGAKLTYVIQTNVRSAIQVYATISPFVRKADGDEEDSKVSIDSVSVDDTVITPVTKLHYLGNEQPEVPLDKSADDVTAEERYELVTFSSIPGTTEYVYHIVVTADQNEVKTAPAGRYVSSITLSMSYMD